MTIARSFARASSRAGHIEFKARIARVAIACALCAIGGCSRGTPDAPAPASAHPAAPVVASAITPGNACERNVITLEDAKSVIANPTAAKNIPGDPQSCKFGTEGFDSLTVSVRPGHGKAALGMYTSGKMDEFDKSAPLPGVGDEAVRSLGLNRITARKGDLLCEITGPGLARESDPMPQKLGALCNKIFAAY